MRHHARLGMDDGAMPDGPGSGEGNRDAMGTAWRDRQAQPSQLPCENREMLRLPSRVPPDPVRPRAADCGPARRAAAAHTTG